MPTEHEWQKVNDRQAQCRLCKVFRFYVETRPAHGPVRYRTVYKRWLGAVSERHEPACRPAAEVA